jgi:hypothetical protein
LAIFSLECEKNTVFWQLSVGKIFSCFAVNFNNLICSYSFVLTLISLGIQERNQRIFMQGCMDISRVPTPKIDIIHKSIMEFFKLMNDEFKQTKTLAKDTLDLSKSLSDEIKNFETENSEIQSNVTKTQNELKVRKSSKKYFLSMIILASQKKFVTI